MPIGKTMKGLLYLIFVLSFQALAASGDDYLLENVSLSSNWSKISKNSEQNVRYLVEVLKRTHTGTRLLKEASA